MVNRSVGHGHRLVAGRRRIDDRQRVCANAASRCGDSHVPRSSGPRCAIAAACDRATRAGIARAHGMPRNRRCRTSLASYLRAATAAVCDAVKKPRCAAAERWPATLARARSLIAAHRSAPRAAASCIASKQRVLVARRNDPAIVPGPDEIRWPLRCDRSRWSAVQRPGLPERPVPSRHVATGRTARGRMRMTAGNASQSLKPTHSTRSVPARSRLRRGSRSPSPIILSRTCG